MLYPKSVSEFQVILDNDKKVVVDFYAEWCGPCKKIAPLFEAMSKQYKDTINFVKVNVDEAEDIANLYDVSSLPTFISFQNKVELKRVSSASPAGLIALIEK